MDIKNRATPENSFNEAAVSDLLRTYGQGYEWAAPRAARTFVEGERATVRSSAGQASTQE